MSFEYLIDPAKGPQWKGLLPGKPVPYVLRKGEGEHAMLFTDLFTVLLSGDETEGQFGIITADSPAGDIIPTHSHNATHETFYVLEGKVRLFFEDAEGAKHSAAAHPGRLRVRAGRLRARLPDRGGRPHDGHAVRRLRAVLPAHGHADRPRRPRTSRRSSRTSRACRPRRSSTTCSSCRASSGRTPEQPIAASTPAPNSAADRRRAVCLEESVPAPAPLPPPAHAAPLPARARRRRWHPAAARRPVRRAPRRPAAGARPVPAAGRDGPAPVVVFLHGGGWRLGSRHARRPGVPRRRPDPFEQVAQAGIAVASVDYRLSGEADLAGPAARRQGRRPLAARPRRRARHRPGPDRRLGRVGRRAPRRAARPDRRRRRRWRATSASSARRAAVSAVAAWYAPSDVAAVATDLGADPADPTTREAQLLGAAPRRRCPTLAAQASPVSHVSPAAPPFLLLHGRADRLIPCVQSERLYAALLDAGVDAELDLYDGADHMWLGAPEAAADAVPAHRSPSCADSSHADRQGRTR